MNTIEFTLGDVCKCTFYKTEFRILKVESPNYELFEDIIMEWLKTNKVDRAWFTIDPAYDIKMKGNWRAHDQLVLIDDAWKVLIYYAADGKHFIKDLKTKEMPVELIKSLDAKIPGVDKHIVADKVDARVVVAVIYNFVNGNQYTFDIKDKTIDLTWITPFVRDNLGRKFASAHIMALRAFKKKLNETQD